MSRASTRVRIKKPFGAPVSRNYSRSILTNREWANVAVNRNVARVDVDTAETEPKTHAVMPAWRYGTSDEWSYLEHWYNCPVPDEEQHVDDAIELLQNELDTLAAKEKPSADDTKRMRELETEIDTVRNWRYWTQAWNTFGDGRPSLYRACSAPNVPFKLRSTKLLQANRPFTLFVHRCKPHEAQKDCYLRFRFGHWGLRFSQEREVELVRYKDGQVWETDAQQQFGDPLAPGRWVTYKGCDFDATDAIEEQVSALRDNGRLTQSDRVQIATWQQTIRDAKAQLKAHEKEWRASDRQDAIDYQNGLIEDAKGRIDELKESKRGLSSADETKIKQLEDKLYAKRETVSFQHAAESLFNTDVALTIVPQPRGFLVLHNSVGKDYFVCEDEDVTSTGLDGTIVDPTRIQIDGNGGALWFSVAYIIPERYGLLESGPCNFGGMPVAGQGELHWDASLTPGSNIVGQVTSNARGEYRWKLEFHVDPDQGYMPFLYRLYFDLLATPRNRARETVVFDSARDVGVGLKLGYSKEKDNRGRALTLTLHLDRQHAAQYEWLKTLQGHQVEVEENGEVIFTGELGEANVDWSGPNRYIEYRAYDRWHIFVADRMWNDLVGDARSLREYIKLHGRGVGLHDDEMILASNAVTERALPHSLPAEDPALMPEWGGSRGDMLSRLIEDFAYWHDLWFDGRGRLHLEPIGATSVPVHLKTSHRDVRDRDAVWDVRETISLDDVVNYIVVLGRQVRGKTLSAVWFDRASVEDEDCDRYRGRVVADNPYHNDALNTQEWVNLTTRWRAWLKGRPLREFSCTTHYRTDLNVGDRFRFDNWVVELLSSDTDDRNSETLGLSMRVIA